MGIKRQNKEEINGINRVDDISNLSSQTNTITQLNRLRAVGFRDELSNLTRSNTNQTGTAAKRIFPQNKCQDIQLSFSNIYGGVGAVYTANTNSVTIKFSIEINGIITPFYFNGESEKVVKGGQTVTTDILGVLIDPTDTVFILTYWDAGSGGYVPTNGYYGNIQLDDYSIVKDSVDYGVDLTVGGVRTSVTYADAPCPFKILGKTLSGKSILLSGDSILNGAGDNGVSATKGYAAHKCFSEKVGFTKMTYGGESAEVFFASLKYREPLISGHDAVLVGYGTNDIYGGLEDLKSNIIKIWTYYKTKGLKVYQSTLLPLTDSTDWWLTEENQTFRAAEADRILFNTWLKTNAIVDSNNALDKVFDVCVGVESVNGKWLPVNGLIHTGNVTSGASTLIYCDTLPFQLYSLNDGSIVEIYEGTGAGQVRYIRNFDQALRIVITGTWATIPDNTSKFKVYNIPTNDGTHPSRHNHRIIENNLNFD